MKRSKKIKHVAHTEKIPTEYAVLVLVMNVTPLG